MFTDKFATAYFDKLVQRHGIKTVIETGTYRGDSTREFCKRVEHVVSIELDYKCSQEARELFARHSNVSLRHGDSARHIPHLCGYPERWLFFLDAHWNDYWPLLDELKGISQLVKAGTIQIPVILIHDFKVPGKPFGFDTYKGQDLDWDYVKDAVSSICPRYAVSTNEQAEGNNRGILRLEPPLVSEK